MRSRRREDRLARLTNRERGVLSLVAEGRSNRSIAEREVLSVKTVEDVIASVFSKLGLAEDAEDNRRVLAVLAYLEAGPRRPTGDVAGGPPG